MKTIKTIKTIFLSFLAVLFFSCSGQNQKKQNHVQNKSDNLKPGLSSSADTSNRPKIKVNVNKTYDDKGQIVRFDSTYSYFYTSPKGIAHSTNDSVFNQFQSFFNQSYPNFFENQNKNVFFNDSLFKYDFFNEDYFLKRFQLNQKNFEGFYRRMDSVKQDFMRHTYPNGHQKMEKKSDK
jgi:hypothetical protein